MRIFPYLILFLLFFVGCKTPSNVNPTISSRSESLPESEKRKFFYDHIANRNCNDGSCNGDSTTDFSKFIRDFYPFEKAININDALIYALEEPYIDSTKIDKSRKWIRVTVDGTWSIPYCVIAEQKNHKTYITFKASDGSGGYYPGTLASTETVSVSDSILPSAMSRLNKLNFWNLNHDNSNYCVTDGTILTMEAMENGKYNLINFYSPRQCGNAITEELEEINFWLQSFIDVRRIYEKIAIRKGGS